MHRISLLVFVVGLMGCKAPLEEPQTGILFSIAETEVSKTDALTQGDEIGAFASIEGTERYFLDNTKYIVGADGRSLSTTPAVYYPEAKQAVTFTAYLPFGGTWDGGLGTFSVPSDQTTALALKEADLCWATASSTPVAAPVALEFTHKMARLLITTNEPTEKIAIPNVFSGGILDIKTGTFTNTLKSEVFTTGTELILPAQPLTRLLLTVAGVEYVFEGAIALETAKTTSINLTFNPTTKTATLAGSSSTNWTGSSSQGNTTEVVTNQLTLHWPPAHNRSAQVDKIVLSIRDITRGTTAPYTITTGIAYADHTFTIPFSSVALNYPYTIEHINFYQSTELIQSCDQLLGQTICKSGASTVGIKDPANAIKIGNLWWATGNLVAVDEHNCKVGAPTDGGLYFQFGSLIGYKGGNLASGGTGVGIPDGSMQTDGSFWNGAATWSWANDAMVWPTECTPTNTWSQSLTTNGAYFGLNTAGIWDLMGKKLSDLPGFTDGTLVSARVAVGDPCRYYLGASWRLPTVSEWGDLFKNKYANGTVGGLWPGAGQNWGSPQANNQRTGTMASSSYTNNANSPTVGRGIYANTAATTGAAAAADANALFFPASGYRNYSNGSFYIVGYNGYGWSSAVTSATNGFYLGFTTTTVLPQHNYRGRSYGLPVRCVSSVP